MTTMSSSASLAADGAHVASDVPAELLAQSVAQLKAELCSVGVSDVSDCLSKADLARKLMAARCPE